MTKLVLVVSMAALCTAGGFAHAEPGGKELEAVRAGLLERDRAWSQTAGDLDRTMSFWSKDAYFLVPGQPMVRGLKAIAKIEEELFSRPGTSLTWKPLTAEVASSGDLGHTIGTYELTLTDEKGKKTVSVGKYLTVWVRAGGGDWLVIADIFNADAPPAGNAP